MIRRLSVLCGTLLLLATLGCGNKGPLYLPEEAPDETTQAATTTSPQSGTVRRADEEE